MNIEDPQKSADTLADLQVFNVFSQAILQAYAKYAHLADKATAEGAELRKFLFDNMPKLEAVVDRMHNHLIET
jgi:hypothetical protein